MTCSECFYFKVRDEKSGECKRYPPTLVSEFDTYGDDGNYYSYLNSDLPDTDADSFCGEFKRK